MTTSWQLTSDILDSPSDYIQNQIILGKRYSLVTLDLQLVANDLYLQGLNVIERIYQRTCVHVLIEVESLEEYEAIRTKFAVEAMNLPDTPEESTIPVITYFVTALLPNDDYRAFSQLVRNPNA